MEEYLFAIVIVAIIQFIVLIVFFVMANNIGKIRKEIVRNVDWFMENGKMESHIGNKQKAKEFYLKALCRIDKDISMWSKEKIENKINDLDK